jgi:hypothetical protein
MTGDFMKRDEFSNTIRTGQYRELLKLEVKHRQRAVAMQGEMDEEDDDIKAKLDQEEAEKAARSKGVRLALGLPFCSHPRGSLSALVLRGAGLCGGKHSRSHKQQSEQESGTANISFLVKNGPFYT